MIAVTLAPKVELVRPGVLGFNVGMENASRRSSELIQDSQSAFTPNYKPAPFVIDRGEGSWLFDKEGNRYLDFTSGIAVNNLGHCPPLVTKAIQKQSEKLIHASNLFWNEPSMELAKELTENSFASRVFFTNSGTESNEAALKIARKYFYDQKKARPKFVSYLSGFHGRSFGALSATPKDSFRDPYEPVVPGFEFAKLHDEEGLNMIDESTAAVILEPIQGEGGVYPVEPAFVQKIKERCQKTGSLLIFDCIQVGMLRAGELFGFESLGVEPDIVSLAKGLGCGVPIGAMITTEEVGASFGVGAHGSTFAGNPVCAAASLAAFRLMKSPEFQAQTIERSDLFFKKMREQLLPHKQVKDLRGRGHMIGIEVDGDSTEVFLALREKKVLITRILPSTLRVLPPLTSSEEEFDHFLKTLLEVLDAWKK